MLITDATIGIIKELKKIEDILTGALEEVSGGMNPKEIEDVLTGALEEVSGVMPPDDSDSVELKALQKELQEIKDTLIEALEEGLECRFR